MLFIPYFDEGVVQGNPSRTFTFLPRNASVPEKGIARQLVPKSVFLLPASADVAELSRRGRDVYIPKSIYQYTQFMISRSQQLMSRKASERHSDLSRLALLTHLRATGIGLAMVIARVGAVPLKF